MEEIEKVKLVLDKCLWKTVTFKRTVIEDTPEGKKETIQNTDFQILPFIPIDIKTKFWVNYIAALFKENSDPISNYIQAEYGLELSIINELTHIRLVDENGKILSIDDVISSGLMDFVKDNIEKYEDFRWELDNIIDLYKEKRLIENSVGKILENLSSKLFIFLDKLQDLDISDEGITKLVTELKSSLNDLDKKWGPTTTKRRTAKNSPVL